MTCQQNRPSGATEVIPEVACFLKPVLDLAFPQVLRPGKHNPIGESWGGGLETAFWLRHLGFRVALVGRHGAQAAESLKSRLTEQGFRWLMERVPASDAINSLVPSSDGTGTAILRTVPPPMASTPYQPTVEQAEYLWATPLRAVVVTGSLPSSVVIFAATVAAYRNVPLCWDAGPGTEIDIPAIWGAMTYLKLKYDEFAEDGETPEQLALRAAIKSSALAVFVTGGARGIWAVDRNRPDEVKHMPALQLDTSPVQQVGVGDGDAFWGGAVSELVLGSGDPVRAMSIGRATAAIHRAGLPPSDYQAVRLLEGRCAALEIDVA